jgi:DNA repair exonuclease SbcCD ATPase subunit
MSESPTLEEWRIHYEEIIEKLQSEKRELERQLSEANARADMFKAGLAAADVKLVEIQSAKTELERQIAESKSLEIWGFYEEKYPFYTGADNICELSSPATVEEINGLVKNLADLERQIAELRKFIDALADDPNCKYNGFSLRTVLDKALGGE